MAFVARGTRISCTRVSSDARAFRGFLNTSPLSASTRRSSFVRKATEEETTPPVTAEVETVEPTVATTAENVTEEAVPSEQVPENPKETSETADTQTFEYTGPEPKKFAIPTGKALAFVTALLTGTFRLLNGAFVVGYKAEIGEASDTYTIAKVGGRQVVETSQSTEFKRPAQPLEIYEFEGCPFCKKVREAVSILDLDVVYYPCPRNGTKFRPKAIEMGGKSQFPYMVDPNNGTAMYESDDIIKYMYEEYGNGEVPGSLSPGFLTTLAIGLALIPRLGKGSSYRASKIPEKPIVYWAYEGSPFCKIVREVLCELEIPHLQKSCARGSPKRTEMLKIAGHCQVPYIQDPNTGIAMFESEAIIDYLEETYGA